MGYKLISAASFTDLTEISASGFKQAINFNVTGKDETIDLFLKAAVLDAEHESGLSLYDSVWEMQLEDFEDIVKIKKAPVTGIDSVSYFDSSNTEVTMTLNTDYTVDVESEPAQVYFINKPSVYPYRLDAVRIRFRAGWADGLPEDIISAIYMAAGDYLINPHDAVRQFPTISKNLLRHRRVFFT
jgi:uncharacterized phiE125 gp8 family phage protein